MKTVFVYLKSLKGVFDLLLSILFNIGYKEDEFRSHDNEKAIFTPKLDQAKQLNLS